MSTPRILVIDNYDSFTYNLVQYLAELGAAPTVWRNDQFDLEAIDTFAPDGIVVSPGPCTPAEAGQSVEVIRRYGADVPLLGVCLGHQAIGAAYGAEVVRAPLVMHGKTSEVRHDGSGPFAGLEPRVTVTRYHSLVVERLPEVLIANAWVDDELPVRDAADDGAGETPRVREVLMGVRHAEHPVWGVQFHPESILTETGHAMLENFLEIAR